MNLYMFTKTCFGMWSLLCSNIFLSRDLQEGFKHIGIGKIFLSQGNQLDIYKDYCNNLELALEILNEIQVGLLSGSIKIQEEDPSVKEQLMKCQLAARSNFPLAGQCSLRRCFPYNFLKSLTSFSPHLTTISTSPQVSPLA